jgi:hypothetical protein
MVSLAQRAVSRHQFSQPPERSYGFWYATLFLLMVVFEAVFIMIFFRSRLSGQTILYMALPIVFLVGLWLGIYRSHQAVYEACQTQRDSGGADAAAERISVILDRLAYVSYAGFTYASVAVAFAYIAVEQCLAHT